MITVDIDGTAYARYLKRRIEELRPIAISERKTIQEYEAKRQQEKEGYKARYNSDLEKYARECESLKEWTELPFWKRMFAKKPVVSVRPFDYSLTSWSSLDHMAFNRNTDSIYKVAKFEKTLTGIHHELTYHLSLDDAIELGLGRD